MKIGVQMLVQCPASRNRGWIQAALLGAIAWMSMGFCGCATVPQTRTITHMPGPVLVLPPMTARPDHAQTATALGRFLYQEIADLFAGQAMTTDQIHNFREWVAHDNLTADGRINLQELTALGQLAGCETVFAWELLEVVPYAPQRMVTKLMVIDVRTHKISRQSVLILDLQDLSVQEQYAQFLGLRKDVVKVRQNPMHQDRFHAATLTPEAFQRFVAFMASRKGLT